MQGLNQREKWGVIFQNLTKMEKRSEFFPLKDKSYVKKTKRPVLLSNWTKITSSHQTELFRGNELRMGTCMLQLVSSYASLKGNNAENITIEKEESRKICVICVH